MITIGVIFKIFMEIFLSTIKSDRRKYIFDESEIDMNLNEEER